MVKDNEVIVGLTSDHDQTRDHHGPALRHVGPLPTSGEDSEKHQVGNYNFEEEYLLGDNKITTRQYDETDKRYRERIEFRQESQDGDYYWIDYSEKDIQPDEYDIYYYTNGNRLVIDLHNKMSNMMVSKNQREKSSASLYYRDSDGNDTLISEKRVVRRCQNQRGIIGEGIQQRNN